MEKISMNNPVVIGIGVLVLILGGLWLMTRSAAAPTVNDTTNTATNTPQTPKGPSKVSSGESISVPDQTAGMSVNVSLVTLTETGWVAVRDDRGWTLGAARFEAGTHNQVSIPLLRTTEAGKRYQALLYIDDGDKTFDLDKEILVTRSDGSVTGAMFSAK